MCHVSFHWSLFPLKAKRTMEWLGEDQVRNALLQGKGNTKQEFFTLSHCLHQIFQGVRQGSDLFPPSKVPCPNF